MLIQNQDFCFGTETCKQVFFQCRVSCFVVHSSINKTLDLRTLKVAKIPIELSDGTIALNYQKDYASLLEYSLYY